MESLLAPSFVSGLAALAAGGVVCPPGLLLPTAAVNFHSLLFFLFAALACGFALGVVISDNVVRMALYLVFSLAATAGLFFLSGAEFVGAMQLMIYVGGTLVLLVFGVMLTAQAPFIEIRASASDRTLAAVAGASLLGLLLTAALSVDAWNAPGAGVIPDPSATPLGMAMVGLRVDDPPANAPLAGRAGYLLPFEIVSVHLLVVLVGAAYLARAKRRRTPRPIEALASAVAPASPPAAAARSGSSSALVGGTR
ncbi:MAG: NADH-quinone oxidoreductase subunit J [Planctomycetia bacterium]